MAPVKRIQLYVDPKFQGEFLVRALIYWCAATAFVIAAWLARWLFTEPVQNPSLAAGHMLADLGVPLVVSLAAVPLVAWDLSRLSNRAAGPVMRLRAALRELAQSGRCEPIEFREGDFWPEIADGFNAVRTRLVGSLPIDRQESNDAAPAVAR
jgi:hypothetical protein